MKMVQIWIMVMVVQLGKFAKNYWEQVKSCKVSDFIAWKLYLSTIFFLSTIFKSFLGGSDSKESACKAGDPIWSLCLEDTLEKGMATYSSILAWRIPWTEEPGGLEPMGSQRVGHDWATTTTTILKNDISTVIVALQEQKNQLKRPSVED